MTTYRRRSSPLSLIMKNIEDELQRLEDFYGDGLMSDNYYQLIDILVIKNAKRYDAHLEYPPIDLKKYETELKQKLRVALHHLEYYFYLEHYDVELLSLKMDLIEYLDKLKKVKSDYT